MAAYTERLVDHMPVRTFETTVGMARAAADQAAGILRMAVAERGVAHAMFATGNSQLAFVDALVGHTPDVPWGRVVVFHMDEYVGVGPDHPAGFQRWIRERIAEPAAPSAAHYLDGRADPAVGDGPLRRPALARTRSTCAVWGSARTATWPSTIRRWPTSPIRWT